MQRRGDDGNDVPAEEGEGSSEMIAFKRDGLAEPGRGWSGVQGRLGEFLGGVKVWVECLSRLANGSSDLLGVSGGTSKDGARKEAGTVALPRWHDSVGCQVL